MTNPHVWFINDTDLIIRLILAVVLGGLIGIEREISNHSAGFRTHILVCLGSTTIMLLSIYGFSDFVDEYNVRMDPARLAAQVISGIGFLGAGAIMRNGNMIKGLTTAASLWVVAAIGLCIGAGFIKLAILSTALVLITLFILNKAEKILTKKSRTRQIDLVMVDNPKEISALLSTFDSNEVKVINLNVIPTEDSDGSASKQHFLQIRITCKRPKHINWFMVVDLIKQSDSILSIKIAGEELKHQNHPFSTLSM